MTHALDRNLDVRHNYKYILIGLTFHANVPAKCGKDSDASPAGRPQSASGGRHRSVVPNGRLLRFSGHAPSQVRDASPCRGRKGPSYRSGSGVRAITSGVLSGPASGCAAGPRRIDSPEARPARSAQTYACHPGLRTPAAGGIAVAEDRRTDPAHSAAVRCGRASADNRTAFGPAGKKTPLTFASTDRRSSTDLVAGYEQLRRRALDGGPGGPGCAMLQRDGMKSWI